MRALIDADVLVYHSAFAAQKNLYHYTDAGKGGEVCTFQCHQDWKDYCRANHLDYKTEEAAGKVERELQVFPEAAAIAIAQQKLSGILNAIGAADYTLFLSGKGNFRDKVGVTKGYKANRKDMVKPIHYEASKAWFRRNKHALVVDGIEADDAIATEQHEGGYVDVVATIDKDLNQIPGKHYDWDKGLRYTVSNADAHWFFQRQLLTGDSTDNIPGLPRIGEVKATDLMQEFRGTPTAGWKAVVALYKAKAPVTSKWEEYLTEQGRLLWLLRRRDHHWSIPYYTKMV